jgi:hypothetical protein
MAYGFSTLYFLAADRSLSIDALARYCSTERIPGRRAGEFMNEPSTRACARLAEARRTFDVIIIDGNHRFDDVLVDFTPLA